MSSTAAGVVFIVSLVIALALAYKPFGDYMFRAVTPVKHSRVERGLYRFIGVNPEGDQAWGVYARRRRRRRCQPRRTGSSAPPGRPSA